MSTLRTAATTVYGEHESVPVLSAHGSDLVLAFGGVLAAGEVKAIPLPEGTQVVEVSVENAGAAAALVRFVCVPDGTTANAALLNATGFRRLVPAGAQLVEPRSLQDGDAIVVDADHDVRLTVHAHVGI